MSGPLNSSRPTTATLAGGVYNASTPAPNDGQAMALQVDNEGNLLVNIAVGGGGGTVTSKIEDSNGNPLLSNGAGALKVDGSLVTQPVSGTVAVSNFPTTQPVSGTVAVSNFPTTQPVSGTVAVSNFPATQPVSAVSLPLPSNAAQETGGNLAALAGTITASKVGVTVSNFPATQPVSGSVSVSNFPATQPVSGTVAVSNFPATQPVSAVSLPLPSNAAQETGGNLATLAGTVTAAKVGVTVSNFPTTQAVSGTVTLGAGSAVIGHVINDAGTALIGKVGIDQTTPGTTNAVQDASDGPVTPGTAATKSSLGGGVVATAAASGTAGQQLATQLDSTGNQRVNPYGATGSVITSQLTGGAGGNPATFTKTVPAGFKWIIQSLSVFLSTNATAGTRFMSVQFNDAAGNGFAVLVAGVGQGASSTVFYTAAPGLPLTTTLLNNPANVAYINMPAMVLGPGFKIVVQESGGNASDSIGTTTMCVLQIPD